MNSRNYITVIRLLCVIAAGLIGISPLHAQHDPRQGGWAHDRSGLQPDPTAIWGELDNGLRTVFLPHNGVPGRVSLRLIVFAGSLDETERERGLAHFLEHMAFNGTGNFEADEITGYFQRLGMEFGSDVNAYTTIDRTVYGMEFTRSHPELVRQGFILFRDFADGILLEPHEIDQERGVILSELRIHDGVGLRINDAASAFFFRGMRFPERSPIGLVEVIRTAKQEDLRRFYQRLYRPDLMVLVAVGDFDVDQYREWTQEYFGDLRRPTQPIPPRPLGELTRERGLRASVMPVRNTGSVSVQASSAATDRLREDSVERRRNESHRLFAAFLLGNRLNERVPGAGGGDAGYHRMGDLSAGIATLSVGPGQWEHGVLAMDDMIRLTHERGFTAEEIERPRERALLELSVQRAQARTMDPAPIADLLVESIAEGNVFLGVEREAAMEKDFMQRVTAEDLNRAFREVWLPDRLAYFLSGEVTMERGSAAVLRSLREGRRSPTGSIAATNPVGQSFFQVSRTDSLRVDLRGPKGQIVEENYLPDFGAHLMRFENNVRLNFVESHQEPGLVRAVVRVGEGLFEIPDVRRGLREFALETVLASGTGAFPAERVQSMLERTVLEFSFDVADHDAFSFRGVTRSEDIGAFFSLVAEFLRAPRFSRHAQQSVKFGAAMDRMSRSFGVPDGVRAFQDFVFARDGRFAWGEPFDYHSLGVSHVRDWLGDALLKGYVEVSLIGDISKQEAVDLAGRTFGILPTRAEEKRRIEPQAVRISAPPGFERLEFIGEQHQAAALGMWPISGRNSLEDRMGLLIVSRVLEQRMRNLFRERLGLAYAPSADFMPYLEYPNFSLIQALVDCAPEDAARIARALAETADELAREGMTEIEFAGALNPVQFSLEQALRTNAMMLERLLRRAQEDAGTIEELRAIRDGAFATLELEKVNKLAKDVLGADRARTAAVVPKPFVGIFRIDADTDGQPVIGR